MTLTRMVEMGSLQYRPLRDFQRFEIKRSDFEKSLAHGVHIDERQRVCGDVHSRRWHNRNHGGFRCCDCGTNLLVYLVTQLNLH